MSRFETERERMVRRDLHRREIRDPDVLRAFAEIPRERFVWDVDREDAYADHPLRIGCGQTISQPYMVALMTQTLAPRAGHRVLEVGTGSGYQTAILSRLAREVFSVERHADLSACAAERLEALGCANVRLRVGDGTLGWPEQGPYDRILVAAAGPHVPAALKQQLAEGGRLVIPVGGTKRQRLAIVERSGDTFTERTGADCIFVKLVGADGWDSAAPN